MMRQNFPILIIKLAVAWLAKYIDHWNSVHIKPFFCKILNIFNPLKRGLCWLAFQLFTIEITRFFTFSSIRMFRINHSKN